RPSDGGVSAQTWVWARIAGNSALVGRWQEAGETLLRGRLEFRRLVSLADVLDEQLADVGGAHGNQVHVVVGNLFQAQRFGQLQAGGQREVAVDEGVVHVVERARQLRGFELDQLEL